MANPHRGQYVFEVDGQRYQLVFKSDAICSIESELNMSLGSAQKLLGDPETSRMAIVKTMFNAALVPKDDAVFGKLWPDEAIEHITKAFNIAFAATPDEPAAAPSPTKPANPSHGIGPDFTQTGLSSASTPINSGTKPPAKSAA